MKKYYLLTLTIALITVSCKKEMQESKQTVTAADSPSTLAPSPCYGNKWQLDNQYSGYAKPNMRLVFQNKLYLFDPVQDEMHIYDGTIWKIKPCNNDVPYGNEGSIVSFMIGDKGYVGFNAFSAATFPHFYEYDFAANNFTPIADFPGGQVDILPIASSNFTIGSKAYIVYDRKIWQYDQTNDTWTPKASIPTAHSGRTYATGFSIGTKGYIVCGTTSGLYPKNESQKLLEYNSLTDSWSVASVFPGSRRVNPVSFVIAGEAYIGGGASSTYAPNDPNYTIFKDYYKYNPVTGLWTKLADVPVSSLARFGFVLNSKGYVRFPSARPYTNPIYRYIPKTCIGTTPF